MPSSPFRDEGERMRARTACHAVLHHHGYEYIYRDTFDRLYPPIVDAPESATRDLKRVEMEEHPVRRSDLTPPDFDAALDEFEEVARKHQHSSREWPYADVIGARQRVREVYEAVVRERDLAERREAKAEVELAALRAAQDAGEMWTVERTTLSDNPMLLFRNGEYAPGEKVRVVKVTPANGEGG